MTRYSGMAAGAVWSVLLALTSAVAAQSSAHIEGGQPGAAGGVAVAADKEATTPPVTQDQLYVRVTPDRQGAADEAGLQAANAPVQFGANRADASVRRRLDRQREQFERGIRLMMVRYGFAADDTQTALIDYITDEEEAHKPLRQSATRLVRALNQPNIPDEKMRSVLMRYRGLLDGDRMRREKAQAALDARINYSQNPRLESMLLLLGVIGDGNIMMMPALPAPPVAVTVNDGKLNNGSLLVEAPVPAGAPGGAGGFGGGLPQANEGLERPATLGATPLNATPNPGLQASASPLTRAAAGASPAGTVTLRAMSVQRGAVVDAFSASLYSELLQRFDANGNRQLDPDERNQAFGFVKTVLDNSGIHQVVVLAGAATVQSTNTTANGLADVNQSSTSTNVIETHSVASMPPKK